MNIGDFLNYSETKTNLLLLQCNDRAMIRLICSIKLEDVAIWDARLLKSVSKKSQIWFDLTSNFCLLI